MSFSPNFIRRLSTTVTKPAKLGQPVFASHPHLIKPDELTPGISTREYESRRQRLMETLPDNSIVVLIGGKVKYMSNQILYVPLFNSPNWLLTPPSYKFRQASDFWYLTGFDEPDAAVILEKASSQRGYKMSLFSSGSNQEKEKWDGARTTFTDAKAHFKFDESLPFHSLPRTLRSLLPAYDNIYVDILRPSSRRSSPRSILKYLSPDPEPRSEYDTIMEALNSSRRKPLAPAVAKLRSIKSPAEQAVMRAAADISGTALAKTMRFTQPGMSEHTIASHFEYLCAFAGSQRPAYVPVVASGPNALVIHYTSNNQIAHQTELVLIDAGCEFNGYASDITRTYPVSGTYSPAQRELYTAVLNTQKNLINMCSEAAGVSLMDLHRKSAELLTVELKQISVGFQLTQSVVERELYPHFVGHHVGIDLHESNHLDRNEQLREGMVITIEPGVYVPPLPHFPKEFHNIGIRIEDDILIGSTGPTILSVNAPKEIADVEGACQGILGLEPF
ncbi:peptidase M24 [Thelephora terrestris]|uniref:Peptidase M24 n=1 Tax=Thelephora terrestris TaxID=56493 RepID=A0A9P6H8V0_9AGAM|nr:peptidase M24 [Thelephora terrestris]